MQAENQAAVTARPSVAGIRPVRRMGAGPVAYENWLAADAGEPWLRTVEYPLLTDVHVTGEATAGPYVFLNTVPPHSPGLVQPAVVLRFDWHASFDLPDMSKTDAARYHGGSPAEEIAALVALALGARFRAGYATREFDPQTNSDPRGRPIHWRGTLPVPTQVGRADGSRILPGCARGFRPLGDLEILMSLPRMSHLAAVTLVRAARLYQDALWMAESEPELSWVVLVSAIETAANYWRQSSEPPGDRLRASKPDLYEYLGKFGPGVVEYVAGSISGSLGSTKKFVDFVVQFLPPPPTGRPPINFQLAWDEGTIRKTMKTIYDYRSRALHDGMPFPAPMCEPPYDQKEWQGPSEKVLGISSSIGGGTWLAGDTPMLLHTFEYITRNALLTWWKSGAQVDVGGAKETQAR